MRPVYLSGGEIEEVKDKGKRDREGKEKKGEREREHACEVKSRKSKLAGKAGREGRRDRGRRRRRSRRRREETRSTGLCIYAIDISTHQLLVIALAHKLHTSLYVTNYFTQPGTLFDYTGWPFSL